MRYDMVTPLVGIMAMSSNDSSEWSDYFKSLDPIHRKRYLEKLLLMGLDDHGDPYASHNTNNFVEDMTLWPPVECGHIFGYFVECPSVFTKQELLQWKSMEAYNYFKNGFVLVMKCRYI